MIPWVSRLKRRGSRKVGHRNRTWESWSPVAGFEDWERRPWTKEYRYLLETANFALNWGSARKWRLSPTTTRKQKRFLPVNHRKEPSPVNTMILAQWVVVAQSLSHVQFFLTPWIVTHKLLCPPVSHRVCSNSCPLSQWCYLTLPSFATLFFCLQSFPASRGQSIGDLHQVPKVLELQHRHRSFQWIFRVDFL